MNNFSIREAIKFGWQTTINHKRLLIGLMILVFLVEQIAGNVLDSIARAASPGDLSLPMVLSNLAQYALEGTLTLGMLKIALNFVDHREAKFTDLFWAREAPGRLISYIGASLLFALMVFTGVVAASFVAYAIILTSNISHGTAPYWIVILVLPFLSAAAYLAVRFWFFGYLIVDRGAGALESLRYSSGITRGHIRILLKFALLLLLLNLAGALALLVGLLVTVPTSLLASAYAYRRLASQAG